MPPARRRPPTVPSWRPARRAHGTPSAEISVGWRSAISVRHLDRERGLIALVGLEQLQVLPADQRVGRCGHRLEGDHVVVIRGVDLRVGIAMVERDFDAPPASLEGERLGRGNELVVEGPRPQRPGGHIRRLHLTRRELLGVEHHPLADRYLDPPGTPLNAGKAKVRVIAEGDRHRGVAGGADRSSRWTASESEISASIRSWWGNGNSVIRSSWAAKSKTAARRGPSAVSRCSLDRPAVGGGEQAMDRQALGTEGVPPWVGPEVDLAPCDREPPVWLLGSPRDEAAGIPMVERSAT